jgi:hypothetical protein
MNLLILKRMAFSLISKVVIRNVSEFIRTGAHFSLIGRNTEEQKHKP